MKTFLGVISLVISWLLSLTLSHFQNPSSISRFLGFLVFLVCLFAVKHLIGLVVPRFIVILAILVSLLVYLLVFSLHAFGVNSPYILWSKFGVGTMFVGNNLQPLGDLAQLTSAVQCTTPVVLGRNVCDPWGRLLNQNVDVIQLMKLLHISNLYFIGLISVIILYLLVLYHVIKGKSQSLVIPFFLITPVTVLAIERGNEIITILLLLSAYSLFRRSTEIAEVFGAFLLCLAAIFKLWPIIFVVAFLILMRTRLRKKTFLFLIAPIVYWLVNLDSAILAMKSTQSGSPFGVSFGATLILSPQLDLQSIAEYCFYTVIILSLLVVLTRRSLQSTYQIELTRLELTVVTCSLLSFFLTWLIGDNFVYRMITLLPALITLSGSSPRLVGGSSALISLMIAGAVTSRLHISIAITNALAIYVIYFIWENRFRFWNSKIH